MIDFNKVTPLTSNQITLLPKVAVVNFFIISYRIFFLLYVYFILKMEQGWKTYLDIRFDERQFLDMQ